MRVSAHSDMAPRALHLQDWRVYSWWCILCLPHCGLSPCWASYGWWWTGTPLRKVEDVASFITNSSIDIDTSKCSNSVIKAQNVKELNKIIKKYISKLSIRGQEKFFCKELESLGSLQRFLSYQSKFYFVVLTFVKWVDNSPSNMLVGLIRAQLSAPYTQRHAIWSNLVLCEQVIRNNLWGFYNLLLHIILIYNQWQNGLWYLFCLGFFFKPVTPFILPSWWKQQSWVQRRTTLWVVTHTASWALEPFAASAQRVAASPRTFRV